jgi:hypothetical protein
MSTWGDVLLNMSILGVRHSADDLVILDSCDWIVILCGGIAIGVVCSRRSNAVANYGG